MAAHFKDELVDTIIDAVNPLLRQNYPNLSLQSTLLSEGPSFRSANGPFVQMLNDSGCHWVVIAGDGNNVEIFDSAACWFQVH